MNDNPKCRFCNTSEDIQYDVLYNQRDTILTYFWPRHEK